MKKPVKKEVFIQQPIYEGGPKAMQIFIHKNLNYPNEAIDQKIQGVSDVRITINHEGMVTDASILKSLTPKCDAEAIRIAKLLKFTVPKNPRKLKVLFHKNIKIHFKLPKVQAAAQKTTQTQKINYVLSPSINVAHQSKAVSRENIIYRYTVNL
jgi:TonB family protein